MSTVGLDPLPAGVDGVEIKVTLDADQIENGLVAFDLDRRQASRRQVWFCEHVAAVEPVALALFARGLILRLRSTDGDADSTVKPGRSVSPRSAGHPLAALPGRDARGAGAHTSLRCGGDTALLVGDDVLRQLQTADREGVRENALPVVWWGQGARVMTRMASAVVVDVEGHGDLVLSGESGRVVVFQALVRAGRVRRRGHPERRRGGLQVGGAGSDREHLGAEGDGAGVRVVGVGGADGVGVHVVAVDLGA
jgi:hypothetical protein